MATRKPNYNTLSYALTIQSRDPIQEHVGTLLAVTDSALVLEQKRPRSSKFEIVFVPKASIIYWYGVIGEDKGAYICRRIPMGTELFYSGRNPTTNIEDSGDGTFAVTLEDGTLIHVNGNDMSLLAQAVPVEVPVAAAPRRRAVAATKPPVEEEKVAAAPVRRGRPPAAAKQPVEVVAPVRHRRTSAAT